MWTEVCACRKKLPCECFFSSFSNSVNPKSHTYWKFSIINKKPYTWTHIVNNSVYTCIHVRDDTVRAPVFGRHQFFGTSEHYGTCYSAFPQCLTFDGTVNVITFYVFLVNIIDAVNRGVACTLTNAELEGFSSCTAKMTVNITQITDTQQYHLATLDWKVPAVPVASAHDWHTPFMMTTSLFAVEAHDECVRMDCPR